MRVDINHVFPQVLYEFKLLFLENLPPHLLQRNLLFPNPNSTVASHSACRIRSLLLLLLVRTVRAYVLKLLFLLSIRSLYFCRFLRSDTVHYQLHVEVVGQVLHWSWAKHMLTWSLLISCWRSLIKSSMLAQLRHFFFCSSGVWGRCTCTIVTSKFEF